ncbi:NADH-quinone oxidoreductase subunit H [bacterium]|nr:NADH-quinone oxidoreductase subunit H [bacterium]
MSLSLMLLLQQRYDMSEARTMWEALRAWLNTEPLPGLRFSPGASNAIMLVTALLFIFVLELLITIGLQVWERRLMARMQGRRGPQEYGGVTPQRFRRIATQVGALIGLPAVLYGVNYWTGGTADAKLFWSMAILFFALGLAGLLYRRLLLPVLNANPASGRGLLSILKFKATLFSLCMLPCFAAAGGLALAVVLGYLPKAHIPFLPQLTVLCTFLAFILYMAYMIRFYWRQGFYDTIKIFFKEDTVPLNADKLLYLIAPILVYIPALLSWVVIPFGVAAIEGQIVYYMIQDLNVGLLLIIADFAMFLVAVIMSGYASNNKYALVGAMREAAMLLTYEIPMLMSLLCVAIFAGSLNLTEIVQRQSMTWGILPLFPAFVIYLVVSLAETNRPPFDLPEAQNELLGGYLVEYSGMRFALFYVAEYSNVFIVSAIMSVCFLGGWKGPMFLGPDGLWLTSLFWFLLKTYALCFFFIWARSTMPRIRVDQIMFFSWKFLLPASVVVMAATAVGVVNRHPWFSANQLAVSEIDVTVRDSVTQYQTLTTAEALAVMSVPEKAFFWGYNVLCLFFGLFILVMAWRILFAARRHPQPRREVSWSG